LGDLFQFVDAHFAARASIAQLRARLEKSAAMFRAVQKRLLVRYRDKNPAPLLNLQVLQRETYEALIRDGRELEALQQRLGGVANDLSCVVRLVTLLIAFKFDLDEASETVMRSFLSPHVTELGDAGWEEATDASLAHLLRAMSGKGGADPAAAGAGSLAPLADTSRLKKRIQTLCERLEKGARPATAMADERDEAASAKS
jgi:Bardet-Biedl syndrome 9 protein